MNTVRTLVRQTISSRHEGARKRDASNFDDYLMLGLGAALFLALVLL